MTYDTTELPAANQPAELVAGSGTLRAGESGRDSSHEKEVYRSAGSHYLTAGLGELFVAGCSSTSLSAAWWLGRGPR
jgi:hypothetical protein